MNEHDDCTCDEDGVLPAWKLSWVDPVRWVLTAIRTGARAVDRTAEIITDDFVMHGKYLKQREDFRSEAGREIEALLTSVEKDD